MGLIDREQRHPQAADRLAKPLVVEPFRSYVEELHLPSAHRTHHGRRRGRAERRIEPFGRNTACFQAVDLVLHERDER